MTSPYEIKQHESAAGVVWHNTQCSVHDRALFDTHRFIEAFIDTPLEVCEQRDPKGMYKKARAGQISGFTGIDSPYEPPLAPDLHIDAHYMTVAQCVGEMLSFLQPRIQL